MGRWNGLSMLIRTQIWKESEAWKCHGLSVRPLYLGYIKLTPEFWQVMQECITLIKFSVHAMKTWLNLRRCLTGPFQLENSVQKVFRRSGKVIPAFLFWKHHLFWWNFSNEKIWKINKFSLDFYEIVCYTYFVNGNYGTDVV